MIMTRSDKKLEFIHSTMPSLDHISGLMLSICEGKFTLDSSCIQASIIDTLNLLLILVLCIVLLTSLLRKNTGATLCWKDWFTRTVAFVCVGLSIVYFGAGFFKLAGNNGSFIRLEHLSCFVRGIMWIALSLSLLTQGSRWIIILISVWWVITFCLASAQNIEVLVKTQHIQIFDVVVWLVNLLLLFCASKNFSYILSHSTSENSISEPLLHKKVNHNLTDLDRASLFSKLIFSWINPLLLLGHSKPLELNDIPCLGSEDEANLAYEKFAHEWSSLQNRKDNSRRKNLVVWAIARLYWKEMVVLGVIVLLRVVSVVVIPILLYAFVNYSNSERHIGQGLGIVGYLILAKVTDMFSYRQFFFYSKRIGLRIRSSLMVATYQKLLKLSSLGKQRHSTGEIVNYIAVDAYRMGEFPMWFHLVWSSGVQVLLSIVILFGIVGIGALPGLVPLLISGFLNVPFARMLQKCQTEFMAAQDKRLRAMSEILNNIKVIKLQSWEEKFKNLVESYRQSEFEWLAKSQYNKLYNTTLYWMSPTIVSSMIFFGCVLLKSAPLDAATIFTILAALRTMGEPVRLMPEALSILIQVKVSFDRINSFLLEDDIKKETLTMSPSSKSDVMIQIEDGHFSWDPNSGTPTLRNIHLEVRRGEKIAVCGPVGSGKSSVLYAILGEIPKKLGMVKVNGSFAYVSQASWIQSGTIRDNILYGKPLNRTKYEEVIRVSALDKDIESFKHGDLTEIGQRGLNLSGGQKQRVQLARAVYSDADIFLLDDPFSAVDAHTSASLFHDCVMVALAHKTVILVTHQVEFLPMVDHILVMEGGKVTQSGSYNELLMTGTAFKQLVVAHRESMTLSGLIDHEIEQERKKEHRSELEETGENNFAKQNSEAEGDISLTHVFQLTEEEKKETGDNGLKTFSDYVTVSKGTGYLILTITANIGFVVLQAGAGYWLAFAVQSSKISSIIIISVYTVISTLSTLFVYLRTLSAVVLGLKASHSFFSEFTNSIFRAPMLFFDSTPVGRILTRASSDLSILDFDVPYSFAFVIAGSIEVVATIGIMASVTWQVLIVGILATAASKYVQGYYQSTARELIRINGTTKAPIMNYTAETTLGAVTIRAFKMEDRFFHNYSKLVDSDAKVFFNSDAALEWFVLRTDVLQNLTLFTAAFLLVLLPEGYIAPGFVGLSLSYAFTLATTQVFLSSWYSYLLNYLISVERVKQFMHIPPEPPAVIEDKRPPSSWPLNGKIVLQDLKIRYRPNAPIVLKGITCTFMEGTRVGVVGRTGSGKTTLISALFRLVEPYSGKIIIDGVDICSIGLKDLRLKLSIIPQEPTLFRGSIRTNLDPLGLYTDEELWKALEKCQLKDTITRLPNLLDSSVSDEGENWSMGQRQLFCLGRVLLKRNKIIVLDEATASIDSATDAILQKLIREEFSNCSVITVAHRVPTVIDSDMVMVLSFGKLVEYDKPARLLETNSYFSKLVAEYWSSCRNRSIHQ